MQDRTARRNRTGHPRRGHVRNANQQVGDITRRATVGKLERPDVRAGLGEHLHLLGEPGISPPALIKPAVDCFSDSRVRRA